VIVINALAIRAGGAAVRVAEVARRAPALWGSPVLLLRNEEAGITLPPGTDCRVAGWPNVLAQAPPLPRRLLEPAVLRWRLRGIATRALLHYGTYVPLRPARDILNVLCFVSLAPWDSGPGARSARNRLLRALFERTRARADLVVVQSQASRDFIVARYPDIAPRTHVLVNGLAVPALVRPSAPHGFLLIGDVHEYRRIDEVVRAYALLDDRTRATHRLRIIGHAGRDPAANARLEEALRSTGVSATVDRPGPVVRSDALGAVAGCAAFVSYANVENGPNALREAKAAGAPLILSDLPVHREFGGPGAVYVRDRAALAEAMQLAAARAAGAAEAEVRPAVDTWDEHVAGLGDLLADAGALGPRRRQGVGAR
jgi:glycosyltransferase involved in cell wall biosynthesis